MPVQIKDFAPERVAVVEPDTPAVMVAQLMRTHHVGALIVVDAVEKTRPIGMVTDRDLVLELLARELANLAAGLAGARDRET
jgi:CBS domain-containing protein